MKKKTLILAIATASQIGLGLGSTVSRADESMLLEEIVVTAQKREENLQDVPIAVTALTDAFITENDVRTVEDLAASVPGLVVTGASTGGQAPISIRGIGGPSGGGTIFNDEPVAVYINGMYIARNGASVQDLVDVNSIQVLRGPQGTLYGRNSTAGALLISTKKPTDEFEGEIRAGYAQYNEKNLSGVISGPLSEQLLARAVIAGRDAEGYADNIVDGSKAGGNENMTGRLSLEYLATDALTIDMVANYSDQESTVVSYSQSALTSLPGPFLSPVYGGNPFAQRADFDKAIEDNEIAYNDPNVTEVTSKDAVLSVNWDLDTVIMDSITGYRTLSIESTQDSDAQPNSATYAESTGALSLVNNTTDLSADQFTQEFRLSSAGDGPLQWIAGFFYIHEDIDFDIVINNVQGGPPVPLSGAVLTPPFIPPFTGFSGTAASFIASEKVDAYALFGDINYQLTDSVNLVFGARYSEETKEADISQLVSRTDLGATLSALSFADKETFTDFSPRFVVEYTPSDTTLLYVSYSKGFKSGGFNSFDASPAAASYPAEEIDAYEIGMKADIADSIRLNATAFYYDYSNLQLRQAVFTGGVSIKTVDEAKVQGFELESTWAATEKLLFKANFSYLDGELQKGILNALPSDIGTIQVSAQQFAPPAVFPTEDVAGNAMTRAPEFQAYLFAEYTVMETDALNVRANVTYKYQDEIFFTETNQDTDTYVGEAWNETDVRLIVSDSAEKWEVALYGQNIFDDRHVTQTAPFAGFAVSSVNEPAKWGAQGVWRF